MVVQHRQIASDLRRQIEESVYPPGTSLPAETELAERYGVSRTTVRQAIVALQAEGILDTRQGARRTVLQPSPAQNLDQLRSFSVWALNSGRTPGGFIVKLKRRFPAGDEAGLFGIAPDERPIQVLRVRTLDGDPIMIERTVYAPAVADLIESLPRDVQSLTETIRTALGISFGTGKHVIDAVPAGSEDAALLGIRRSSAMLRHRYHITSQTGQLYHYSDDRYRPGAMAITFDNTASASTVNLEALG